MLQLQHINTFTDDLSLKVLDVGYNNFSDDGISLIVEWLQTNTTLTTLKVECCGLTTEGI